MSRVDWRGAKGFSLIEVMVALLVLAIGLLGLAALQTVSLQGGQNAYYRTQATNLAYEVSDFARVNRSVVLATCNLPILAGWTAFVGDQLPAGALTAAVTDCPNGEVTVTVTWSETRLADAAGGAESVVVRTRI
jgi:type IV pilus assembly protein PilV